MAKAKLKPGTKIGCTLLLGALIFGAAYQFYIKPNYMDGKPGDTKTSTGGGAGDSDADRTYRVALSEWPGHMALVIGNGGLKTAEGSTAAKLGLDLEIVFIEDPIKKNAALQAGKIDFVWQVVDEMPINMGGYKNAGVDARAFLQVDWSRGGDACVATKQIQKVEDILGHKSAMMMFSPDHTVFEFMINNSRLTKDEVKQVRKDTRFSLDDFTFGRVLFTQGKVDVACLWEPDVTLALAGRPGAHRLFSTADATELIADVLLARQEFLTEHSDIAEKVAKTWFGGVETAMADKPAAARLIAAKVPRFRDELGYQGTLNSFNWVKWTGIADNAYFFGLDGGEIAFDRVYNQADSIWTKYPEAEITNRFAPSALRNLSIVKRIWEAEGRKTVAKEDEPVYKPEVAETGEAVFTKPVTINFDSGKAELDPESMHILNNQVLPQLQMAGGMYVRVEGNTDGQGGTAANLALSKKRADSVVEFLVGKGLDKNRITGKGNGEDNPLASNKTADGRAQNRRTDILFISGAK
jgi:outer membrane protein OmpA-like peptidoglycan-associated protein/ABC-type nitrate/sulfonate/bicarbonate transport system substrate-binding protein